MFDKPINLQEDGQKKCVGAKNKRPTLKHQGHVAFRPKLIWKATHCIYRRHGDV